MFFTINRLLETNTIEDLKLLAGEGGKANIINNTNIMDNPETFDWLMPGDFVITTGFVFKDDEEFQLKVIRELSEINCAALAIKTKKYFGQMPQTMIDAANKYDLPLLEIPQQYSLAQVSNIINKETFKAQDSILQKSIDIHEQLTEITLAGGGSKEIAEKSADLINNPLIIVDSKWNLLTYVEHADNPYPLEEILNLKNRQKVFPLEFIKGVPNDVANFKKSIKRKYNIDEKFVVCRIMPISALNELYGYIVIWETVNKMKKIDYIALERASITLALDRIKVKEIEEAKHQIRRDFFDDLLTGKIESSSGVNSLAELHGMDTNKNYVCMVIRINTGSINEKKDIIASKRELRNIIEIIIRAAEELARDKKFSTVSIYRGNQIILFLPVANTESPKTARDFSKEFGRELYESTKKTLPHLEINIGMGKLYDSILKLNFSFAEAQEVIKMGKKLSRDSKVLHFEDFVIYHLLESGTSRVELESFYENTVAELVRHDLENKTNLVETLEQYFAYQGNISEASKELYIHRNTFIYRLDKIKTILNTDLRDAEEALEIQLGLKIMQILRIRK